MIRILHSVSNMDRAGIETMLMNYYRYMDKSKVQFDFLCNKKKPGAYDDEIKSMGGRIYHTPGLNPAKYPVYLKYMRELFQEHPEYKIVEAHNGALGVYALHAAKRQEEKLSAEKAEIVKQRIALYEQYADGNISKEEFVRQRDAYRAQEDERMEQIQRLRAEKNQIFLPVRKDADNLQTVVSAAEEAGDVMRLSQNVVETFIDRIEVFNDERVKIRFTFEDVLAGYAE